MKFKSVIVTTVILTLNSCTKETINEDVSENISSTGVNEQKPVHVCLDKKVPIPHVNSRREKTLLVNKLWENEQTIRVKFLSGSESIQESIWKQAVKWEDFANVDFELVTSGSADIRINIDNSNASWSYIGTDVQHVDSESATMNFGWFTENTSEREFARTTLHEFGHALGAVHEHQNALSAIQWDKDYVIGYYEENFGWTEDQVQKDLFDKYSTNLTTHSTYDPDSIMNYAIDNAFTLDDFSIEWNYELSLLDKAHMKKTYPFETENKHDNLALGKVAEQSSLGYSGNASRAVDGNRNGSYNQESVTHTLIEDKPWWQVRLGEDYAIGVINIYNRKDNCCKGRLKDFDVFVYNDAGELVFKTRINEAPNPFVSINTGGIAGSRVRVKLSGTDNALSLAEVEVLAY